MRNGPIVADELRLGIEALERIQSEIDDAKDNKKAKYVELKSRGFDVRTIKRIEALRRMDPNDRREYEALLDIYKGALGMLDGTPLGNWAVEKLAKKPDEPAAPDGEDPEDGSGAPDAAASPEPDVPEEPAPPPPPELTVDDAKRLGSTAAREGRAVTANPFPPRDPRRAAWDEAWCQELGSDGMDIPEVLRPTKTAKPATGPTEPVEGGEPEAEAPAVEDQEMLAQARLLVIQHQKASASHVQRELKIGYNRAARCMEWLERQGVISPVEATGTRTVLFDENGQRK